MIVKSYKRPEFPDYSIEPPCEDTRSKESQF
jgi:hypothetical protein